MNIFPKNKLRGWGDGKLEETALISLFTLVLTIDCLTNYRLIIWLITLLLTMGGRIFAVPLLGWLEVEIFLTVVVLVEETQIVN